MYQPQGDAEGMEAEGKHEPPASSLALPDARGWNPFGHLLRKTEARATARSAPLPPESATKRSCLLPPYPPVGAWVPFGGWSPGARKGGAHKKAVRVLWRRAALARGLCGPVTKGEPGTGIAGAAGPLPNFWFEICT